MYRNYQNKHAFWKNCTINIFPLPPNFIFTVLYTCIARGRSRFLNLCPIPDVILYNKNMFNSIQLSFCVQNRSGKNCFLRTSKGCIKNQCRLQLLFSSYTLICVHFGKSTHRRRTITTIKRKKLKKISIKLMLIKQMKVEHDQ